jgi:hypothetical protein
LAARIKKTRTRSIELMETAKLGLRRVALVLAVWLLLAVAVVVGGPAVHGEETPTATPTPKPTATRTATTVPTVSPEPTNTPEVEGSSPLRQHYVRGKSNVVFQWGMLVDSLALGISYAWLVGGLVAGIGLPIVLVVWWLRSRRRRPERE